MWVEFASRVFHRDLQSSFHQHSKKLGKKSHLIPTTRLLMHTKMYRMIAMEQRQFDRPGECSPEKDCSR